MAKGKKPPDLQSNPGRSARLKVTNYDSLVLDPGLSTITTQLPDNELVLFGVRTKHQRAWSLVRRQRISYHYHHGTALEFVLLLTLGRKHITHAAGLSWRSDICIDDVSEMSDCAFRPLQPPM